MTDKIILTEKQRVNMEFTMDGAIDEIIRLRAENERYRKALRAVGEVHLTDECTDISGELVCDPHCPYAIAREALGGNDATSE